MRLVIRAFRLDLLDVELTTTEPDDNDGPGDYTSTPVGFTHSPPDQRWQETPTPELT